MDLRTVLNEKLKDSLLRKEAVGRVWEEEEGAGFDDLLLISLHFIEWQFSSSSLSYSLPCSYGYQLTLSLLRREAE